MVNMCPSRTPYIYYPGQETNPPVNSLLGGNIYHPRLSVIQVPMKIQFGTRPFSAASQNVQKYTVPWRDVSQPLLIL